MNKESELTVSTSLNQMYDLALDHAIDICRDSMFGKESSQISQDLVNAVLKEIINKLQNLRDEYTNNHTA